MTGAQILLEVLHEGPHWIPCEYMTRVVESVAAGCADSVRWEKVITKTLEGARRWQQLSKALGRPAPVPSIFIDGRLVFESTPGPEELKAYLDTLAGSA